MPIKPVLRPNTDQVLVITIDHHRAACFLCRPSARHLEDVRVLHPHEPDSHWRHLKHRSQTRLAGERAPEDPAYCKAIEALMAQTHSGLILGSATGKSGASDILHHRLSKQPPAMLHHAVFRKVDLSALINTGIVDIAVEIYGATQSEATQ